MKQHYVQPIRYWLMAFCVMSSLLRASAQRTQPPVQQWQRSIDGPDLSQTSMIRAGKASGGGYGVLVGNQLVLVSQTGELIWTKPVPGSYADSSTNRIAIQKTLSLAPTQHNGFVVLAQDVINRYYVTKLDSAGNSVWTKTVARQATGSLAQATQNALTPMPDGSFFVVGSYTDAVSYLTITKLSAEGYITGEWRINYAGLTQSATPLISQILSVPHQSYLLVGRATDRSLANSQALAIQVDEQFNVVWHQLYANLSAIQDVTENPQQEGNYIAVGSGANNTSRAITIAPNKPGDGTVLASLPDLVSAVSVVNDDAGNVTVLDAAPTNNGDFRLTNGSLPTNFYWTKTYGGSGKDVPTDLLATDDGGYLMVGTTTSTDGDVTGKTTNVMSAWVLKIGKLSQVSTLRLEPPVYHCQTGFIRFQTSGGDGSPITYTASGITRTNPTDAFGTVESGLRGDPKVILIQASQSGQTVRYRFDLATYCPVSQSTAGSTTDSLRLLAPTYNCQTGTITFRSTGGDSSPVEYNAAGITDWTTNPNQFVDRELRTAYDAQPLILQARQRGRVATYVFNLKAACGRARVGVSGSDNNLTVTVLGNPVHETAVIEVVGAESQSVGFQLVDARGRLIEQRTIRQTDHSERHTFDLRSQSVGTFLLHTSINDRTQTIKFLKQ